MTRKICSSTVRLLVSTRLRAAKASGRRKVCPGFACVGAGVAPLTPPLFKGRLAPLLVSTAAAFLPSRDRLAARELRGPRPPAGRPPRSPRPHVFWGPRGGRPRRGSVVAVPPGEARPLVPAPRPHLWNICHIPGPVPEGPKHCRPKGRVRASRTMSNGAVLIHSRQPKNLKKEKYLESL